MDVNAMLRMEVRWRGREGRLYESGGRALGFLVIGLFVGLSVFVRPSPAFATTCTDSPSTHFRVQYRRTYSSGNVLNNRGMQVVNPGVWVASGTTSCNRVSSMGLLKDSLNEVEFGWAMLSDQVQNQCGETGGSSPWRLTYIQFMGQDYCPEGQGGVALNGGQDKAFEIANPDADGHWDFYYGGTYIVTNAVNVTWSTAQNVVNGERIECSNPGCTQDSAFSRFNGIQFGSGSGFNDWNTTGTVADTDPDFDSLVRHCDLA